LGEALEVVKGVAPGTKVIANPSPTLRDGARVAVRDAKG
jgi:hypothetical protein